MLGRRGYAPTTTATTYSTESLKKSCLLSVAVSSSGGSCSSSGRGARPTGVMCQPAASREQNNGSVSSRCSRVRTSAAASGPGSAPRSSALSNLPRTWDKVTDRLVGASSIPFSILVLPQVMQNFANTSAGNNAALAIISWEGYTSALLGNTLMCSYFACKGERSAVTVQLIGILNNLLVLCQLAMAGAMSRAVFLAVAVASLVASAISVARVGGAVPAGSFADGSAGLWRWYQAAAVVFGFSVIPQILYTTFFPAAPSTSPALIGFVAVSSWLLLKLSSKEGRASADALLDRLPGWGATIMFALSPLPQLVRNFTDPRSLEGLSLGTLLLAMAGNMLMLPRALLTRDAVWLAGTAWACLAGWGQILGLFMRLAPATGAKYVSEPIFLSVTSALAACFALVLVTDGKVKRQQQLEAELRKAD